jgi:hypothetical protein
MSSRQRLNPLDLNSISFENINVSNLFRNNELAKDRASLMDLRCLSGKTDFIPGKAFVRGEMQTTFKRLCEKKAGKKHILIGSPGVGKSVVFFLAALSLSAVKNKQVIYARWDKKKPTVFLMKPGQSEGFCQVGSISFYKVQYSLEDVARAALDYGYESDKEDWRFFLDGPNETEVKELTDLDFFLCTSGGYSTPSDSERMTVVIDIMAGWMEDDLVAALIQLKKITPNQARKVYGECGGRMRLALDYVEDEQTTINWADSIVADQSADACILAVTETESRTSVESKDRLRTMFRGSSGRPVQLVDSQYLLRRLRDKLTIDDLRQAYRIAVALDSRTMMGVLFEEIMHKWVQQVKPNPVSSFVR